MPALRPCRTRRHARSGWKRRRSFRASLPSRTRRRQGPGRCPTPSTTAIQSAAASAPPATTASSIKRRSFARSPVLALLAPCCGASIDTIVSPVSSANLRHKKTDRSASLLSPPRRPYSKRWSESPSYTLVGTPLMSCTRSRTTPRLPPRRARRRNKPVARRSALRSCRKREPARSARGPTGNDLQRGPRKTPSVPFLERLQCCDHSLDGSLPSGVVGRLVRLPKRADF